MTASPLTDVAQRLLANVDADRSDQLATSLHVPAADYLDPERWNREMEAVFHRSPLLVALSCDVPGPGDHLALDIAQRPLLVVRGDDGAVRVFLNACRHRGAPVVCRGYGHARRLTCPYHAWVYDNSGSLVGLPGRESYGEVDVTGLIELPSAERSGAIFAIATPGVPLDIDTWLGDMAGALAILKLDELHRYDAVTELPSGNWKATADGYVDGYHLGYLHRNTIGLKSITNRNTYDCFGPHVRIGFANKPILATRADPVETWPLPQVMSLVHYVFPNVSMSGQPGAPIMLSRILPGPTIEQSLVTQTQYFREPIAGDDKVAMAEQRRALYAAVTADEDFSTVMDITKALPAINGDVFRFGRNEVGNQTLHRWVDRLVGTR